jgi:hypothetical protein
MGLLQLSFATISAASPCIFSHLHSLWVTRREADWRRQLARTLVYATGQSPEVADKLLAEYERREQEGPDFMRQRPGGVIAGGRW